MWTGLFEGVGIAALTTVGVGLFLGPGIVFGLLQLHRGDQLERMQVRLAPAAPAERHDEPIVRPATSHEPVVVPAADAERVERAAVA